MVLCFCKTESHMKGTETGKNTTLFSKCNSFGRKCVWSVRLFSSTGSLAQVLSMEWNPPPHPKNGLHHVVSDETLQKKFSNKI